MSFCNVKKNTLPVQRQAYTVVNYFLLILIVNLLFVSVSSAAHTFVGSTTMVIGSAYIEKNGHKKLIRRGEKISVGDTIFTRSNGHVHIKFDDQGIVSVRPNSELVIEQYRYNVETPSLSTVKFNLIKGVARSISGHAAKAARARFRMNTPIAAIGVRGTDFIVSANDQSIKAFVNEGIIVVSPFSDLCSASTLGPCSAGAVELHGNKNQLLELNYWQSLATIRSVKVSTLPRLLYKSSSDGRVEPSVKESDSDDQQLKSNPDVSQSDEEPSEVSTDTSQSNDEPFKASPDASEFDDESSESILDAFQSNDESFEKVIDTDDSTSDRALDEDKTLFNSIAQAIQEERIIIGDDTSLISIDATVSQVTSTLDINAADTDLLKPELTKDLSAVDDFSYVIPNAPLASEDLTRRQLVWGRWNIDSTQQLISTSYQEALKGRTIGVSNTSHGLFRQDHGQQKMAGNLGRISFDLHLAEVNYFTPSAVHSMLVKDGFLEVNFNSRAFSTGLNLNSTVVGDVNFRVAGSISDRGFFNQSKGASTLGGTVSFDGKEAAYFFDQKLNNGTIKGTTLWGVP